MGIVGRDIIQMKDEQRFITQERSGNALTPSLIQIHYTHSSCPDPGIQVY